MAGQYPYPTSLREEGLKNRVAKDWFSPFDCTRIIGNIDFCVDILATELALGYEAEPVLWAEAKAGNRRDIVASVEYHWGNDLSGSRGGAAGVGGLLYLSVSNSNSQLQLFIPRYDSNGNIMGYWDDHGKVAASFDYGAFGETSTCGDDPAAFPIRFSTKYHDVESDLYYYTKRFYSPSLRRWLTREPIEEVGGMNLYSFLNNNSLCVVDVIGESPYVLGEIEPERRNKLNTNTWNTMRRPLRRWWIIVKTRLTILGGRLQSMPDASRHLSHFLGNSGKPLEIRFAAMNRESRNAHEHMIREINDALLYAEKLGGGKKHFLMVTPREVSSRNGEGNWFFAVGEYTTWARASVVKCRNKFQMNWHFYFRDIYDWELNNGLAGGFVSDREMALLHRYGVAREFEMNGRHFIHVEWEKGQRLHTGAKVIGM